MFWGSIDSKASKIKLNVEGFLNEKKKETLLPSQPIPSIRRPEQPSPISNAVSQHMFPQPNPSSHLKPVEYDLKQIMFQGKLYDKTPLSIKNIIKERSITVFYIEDHIRYKLEIRAMDNIGHIEVHITADKNTAEISFKKAVKYKFFKQENGEPKWMLTTQVKDEKIAVVLIKEVKNLKSYFEGIVPEECIKVEQGEGREQGQDGQRQETQDTDDIINFIMPTTQQLADTEKSRKAIKDMKEDEKVMIIMDIFKVKKEYEDNLSLDRKRLKCPIFSCQKYYRQIPQLKAHMKKHPELNKHGIQLTQFGTFQFGTKALDLALFLGKLYPFEMKKIIRKMKTRQLTE